MSSIRDTLQRESERYSIRHGAFDRMTRRRDRKRRNERTAALVVGLAIVIGIVVVGSAMLRSAHEPKPADRKHHSLLREGEVLELGDDGATLVATDTATKAQRTLACTECPQLREFALSAGGGWIAYTPACGGVCPPGYGLWVVGANRPPILATTEPSGWAWSPTAELLVFADGYPKATGLILLDPATGERTTIATSRAASRWITPGLAWSPDGTQLAFTGLSSGIRVVDLETGVSTSIDPAGEISEEDIAWSPDGMRLVLVVYADGRPRIIVVNADGSDRRILVDHGLNDQGLNQDPIHPSWSPDGTRIAYVTWPRGRQGDVSEIWVIGADGSDATRLFHGGCCVADPDYFVTAGSTRGPVWSPDGSRIAFKQDTQVEFGIWLVVNSDGTGSPERIDEVVAETWEQGR